MASTSGFAALTEGAVSHSVQVGRRRVNVDAVALCGGRVSDVTGRQADLRLPRPPPPTYKQLYSTRTNNCCNYLHSHLHFYSNKQKARMARINRTMRQATTTVELRLAHSVAALADILPPSGRPKLYAKLKSNYSAPVAQLPFSAAPSRAERGAPYDMD